jgi:hypothetical protein
MRYCILILLGLPACAATRPIPTSDPELTVVLTALEDELATVPRDSVPLFHQLVGQTVQTSDFEAWLTALFPESFRLRLPIDLLRHYWLANKAPRRLSGIDRIGGHPVRLVSRRALSGTPTLVSASRVGFSPTGDSAILTLNFACPGLCGSSDLWLYVHNANGWERRRLLLSVVH